MHISRSRDIFTLIHLSSFNRSIYIFCVFFLKIFILKLRDGYDEGYPSLYNIRLPSTYFGLVTSNIGEYPL